MNELQSLEELLDTLPDRGTESVEFPKPQAQKQPWKSRPYPGPHWESGMVSIMILPEGASLYQIETMMTLEGLNNMISSIEKGLGCDKPVPQPTPIC